MGDTEVLNFECDVAQQCHIWAREHSLFRSAKNEIRVRILTAPDQKNNLSSQVLLNEVRLKTTTATPQPGILFECAIGTSQNTKS